MIDKEFRDFLLRTPSRNFLANFPSKETREFQTATAEISKDTDDFCQDDFPDFSLRVDFAQIRGFTTRHASLE